MTRCDYDAVFYRVFCVTLLAIAFTFTVILTNVFVDIDGLLANKKEKLNDNIVRNELTTEAADNDEMNFGESDDSYRTKRSIETQSFLFHIKNPKVKNILANRLTKLLEELEAEETADLKPTDKKIIKDIPKVAEKPKLAEDENKDKMLHLSMHNVLLQGIERHMDLNDVYKRMFSLMTNFNEFHDKKDEPNLKPNDIGKKRDDARLEKPIEDKFFDEMVNYNELQDQIIQSTTVKPAKAHPNVVIKTVIDITSIGNDILKENDTKTSNENIQGDIEIVYNGKAIKFTHSDAKIEQPTPQKSIPVPFKPRETSETTTDYNMIPKSYMNKFVEEYFKHFPHDTKDTNNEVNRHFQTKRLKRHVRIKYENDDPGQANKSTKKNTEEDELYVEIETHFDSKGMKGEKKKKLIKNLIDKIQKALHSDMTTKLATSGKNSTQQRKSIHFRKRIQNPLEHSINHILLNKYSLPITNFVHRELHPITKTVDLQEQNSPGIGTKSGENWKKQNLGPGFLAGNKAINSAEMSEVNVDYSKILEVNGIPQRLQQPLNSELSEETIKTNSYYDMGKRKFVIKDIDGSGFSVGFNQYVDEPPDKESMRLFSGLENVIKSYHQTYDAPPEPVSTPETNLDSEEEMEYPNNEHIIERRSINKTHDYHSNEYKIIFNKDFLNYNNYRDIYKQEKKKPKLTSRNNRKSPLILDENIFEKNLNPSEIFSLANLFQRKKRAISVKKINDLSTRLKFNRFLNTNAMSKTIFLNTKRNKRQINKIRIIATDLPHMSKQSDENMFVVSDENVFADRALVKEVDTSDDHEKQEEYHYQNNEPGTYITKIFDGRSRHNPLMSKYPHIFMEEVSRSREQYIPNNALLFGKLPGLRKTNTDDDNNDDNIDIEQFLSSSSNDTEQQKQLKDQEIVNALTRSPSNKANYKVTVKIMPKNQTGLNSGFKEIHTSINKSFNKNGLLYSSLVNVSEISKVIKLNRSIYEGVRDDKVYTKKEETTLTRKIQDQQEKMQFLLKQHSQHINEQLNRLNEEKMNLESMLNGNNPDNNADLDSNALSVSMRRLKLDSKEIVGTTAGVTPIEVHTTTVNIKPREELPQSTTPPAPPTQLQNFSEKVKNNNIISTIERNGNLTDQILQKIDRNTEILQMFLQKLSERIEVVPTPSLIPERVTKDDNTFPTDWRNQEMPFTQNMVIRKNDSHISIPFTYAYQPPTSPSLKSKTQTASVIYQGHIRNAVRHRDVPHAGENQGQKISEVNNQSRFFIDELENEYKVVQMGGSKKNRDYNMVNRNGTL